MKIRRFYPKQVLRGLAGTKPSQLSPSQHAALRYFTRGKRVTDIQVNVVDDVIHLTLAPKPTNGSGKTPHWLADVVTLGQAQDHARGLSALNHRGMTAEGLATLSIIDKGISSREFIAQSKGAVSIESLNPFR